MFIRLFRSLKWLSYCWELKTKLGRLQKLMWQFVQCRLFVWFEKATVQVIIIGLQLQETQNIKFEMIKVLYHTKTHLYKSNYQSIPFIIARGYHEKHITRLDIIVSKWDRIAHFVWAIMSGSPCKRDPVSIILANTRNRNVGPADVGYYGDFQCRTRYIFNRSFLFNLTYFSQCKHMNQ